MIPSQYGFLIPSSASGPITTLIPAGHFSNLTPPLLSSLTSPTLGHSNSTTLSGSRSNPSKYNVLTMNFSDLSNPTSKAGYFWAGKLIMQTGSSFTCSGDNGADAVLFCGNNGGGNGGNGGAGGGGGGGTDSGCVAAQGGPGGPYDGESVHSTDGQFGDAFGCVIQAQGGTGYARRTGLTGYLDDTSPFPYLYGGIGGGNTCSCICTPGGVPTEPGYGGGGSGGYTHTVGGGGAGGGAAFAGVIGELVITSVNNSFISIGGDGGFGQGCCCGEQGNGGGGGSIQLFINKVSSATLLGLSIIVDGGNGMNSGEQGNFAIYEVSKTGAILNTYNNTVPTVGWDHS